MSVLKYIANYPEPLKQQVQGLIDTNRLGDFLLKRYPNVHEYGNDRALYDYTLSLKNRYLRKSLPLSKVVYDKKLQVIKHALGTHTTISRVQGNKLKSKNEIRVDAVFKAVPEELLSMIVVHELAHLKEKEHNKAFYQLCRHMAGEYHQWEFDLRLYLTHIDLYGKLWD